MGSDRLTPRGKRPLVELTPALDVYWLTRNGAIPHQWPEHIAVSNISLKVPGLVRLVCNVAQLEAMNLAGDKQIIRLAWYYPISGPQPLLVCPACQHTRKVLYCHRFKLACRFCHNAVYFSQCKDKIRRPCWQLIKAKAKHGTAPAGTTPMMYQVLAYYGR